MAETTFQQRGLIDGVGNLFLSFMETEETNVNPPKYDTVVYETPSIDTVDMTVESTSRDIFLSNVLHDQLENVTKVTLSLQAGYLPEGFAEKAQGMIDDGDGAWSFPTNPKKVPFKMAFPATDMNDDEIIFIFPKCTLTPQNHAFQTRREERQEQIPTFEISGVPLIYKKADEPRRVYHRIDLTTDDAKQAWDRVKLLTEPIYDKESLAKAKATGSLDI